MSKHNITKDDKLCFALDYIPVQKKYKKTKKARNSINILSILTAGISVVLGFVSLPSAVSVAILGSLVLLPSMYVFNSKMREIVNTANHTNISFRQFRKMERSGELDKLLKEANSLFFCKPSSIGIEKITSTNTLNKSQPLSYQANVIKTNNSGRDL